MKEVTQRQKFLWNMAGSLCNSLSSVLLLLIVNHISGTSQGGFFALAYSTAQLLFTVGSFEIRPVQSTDILQKNSFSQYFTSRLLNGLVMLLCILGYIIINGYHGTEAVCIFWICGYRLVEAFADVYSGLFQQRERIDLSGKEMLMRSGFSTILFTVVLMVTGNLLWASMALTLTSALIMLTYDVFWRRKIEPGRLRLNFQLGDIYKSCWVLFIAAFIMNYLNNAPKYGINRYFSQDIQNTYNILFMPAFVINLLSLFAFRPLLTDLAKYWEYNQLDEFIKVVKKMLLLITALTLAGMMGAYLLGIPILSLIYGVDLSGYEIELVVVMICGGLNAFVYCLYYVITVMHKQKLLLAGYLVALIETLIVTPLIVKNGEILGGALAATLSYAILALIFTGIMSIIFIQRKQKDKR